MAALLAQLALLAPPRPRLAPRTEEVARSLARSVALSVGPIDIEAAVNKERGGTTSEQAGMQEGKREDSNQIQSDPRAGHFTLVIGTILTWNCSHRGKCRVCGSRFSWIFAEIELAR